MLKIRMQRIGKKGQAYFRLVVTEHTTRPKGEYLELLGSYDPHQNTMEVKTDRVKHWMSKGAKLSATANNLLVGKKLIEGEKVQVWKAKKKPAEATPTPPAPASQPKPEAPKEEPVPADEKPAPADGGAPLEAVAEETPATPAT